MTWSGQRSDDYTPRCARRGPFGTHRLLSVDVYGKVRRSAVLGIARCLMRGKEPRHASECQINLHPALLHEDQIEQRKEREDCPRQILLPLLHNNVDLLLLLANANLAPLQSKKVKQSSVFMTCESLQQVKSSTMSNLQATPCHLLNGCQQQI
jgi:hypothetical protein